MRVLITGASRGIGAALARVFSEHGHTTILVGRNEADLRAVAAGLPSPGSAVRCDLTNKDDIDRLVLGVGHVDCLVNNAGAMYLGDFIGSDPAVLMVNAIAALYLTQGILNNGCKKILNVSSICAWGPQHYKALYGATKAFLLSLSLSLRTEGYQSTCLCPGPTRTNLLGIPPKRGAVGVMEPYAVALAGYRGLMKNRAVVVPGALNWGMVYFLRFLPIVQWWLKRKAESVARRLNTTHEVCDAP